ncbi:pyrroline-5-carboxylate reductase [Gluconacetobacter entanii]|uniref:Pyrroline-5-carboxylate reductase n=1 Tax=Gluconacetobacter entanii TaxID=108528 RepID=A0ABT3K387_9PROT|nr:pyrroline-5-carboxylate reductase [Gluconacetobacter entanii]MBE7620373.1 pyrroline-5-carboxylate reductase [Komagataeibacter sp. FXV2]MCW4589855.1 pyrroline-5-carboxylate reductase [Gluconacetobacter entanii]MCW4593486.1 pyrroline-5-carboxylate reductase [Gluconacetobacter entanii]NPC88497.1 pyrroline-5-carboxylate reductase [Gluconacetobacter entanii]
MADAQAPSLPPVLLVGCGKMGGAMLEGWLAEGLAPSVVVDRHRDTLPAPHRLVRDVADLPADFRPGLIVLAMKPQKVAAAIAAIAPFATHAPVLSVLAGRTVGGLTDALRAHMPAGAQPVVIRAMPNTPAAVGEGMTVSYAPPCATAAQRSLCDRVLSAIGQTAWVEHEDEIDVVTAISGSGPAYVFLLAELLEQAGVEGGLPPALARQIARQTVSGAGVLMQRSGLDAEQLRRNVTSPNGTTAQALSVLMAPDAWPATLRAAIRAASQRARELAS